MRGRHAAHLAASGCKVLINFKSSCSVQMPRGQLRRVPPRRPPVLFTAAGMITALALLRDGSEAVSKQAWHITDIHIDIYYAEGTVPDHGCYCAGSPTCTVPCGQPPNASNGTKTQTGPCQGFPCSGGPEHLAVVPCCPGTARVLGGEK